MIRPLLTVAMLMNATAAVASDVEGADEPSLGIPVEEWVAMVQGRTVTYKIDGQVWAQEAYGLSGNTVAIRLADGTCMEGIWSYENGEYCFAWSGGEYSCFLHLRVGGEILVIPVVDGVQTGTVQTVGGVSDLPLTCGPALTS